MTVGMSAPPMGTMSSTPKARARPAMARNRPWLPGWTTRYTPRATAAHEDSQVHEVLAPVGDGALGQDLLELAEGHEAGREGQEAEDHLEGQGAHGEAVDPAVARPEEVLRRAHEGRGEGAEGVGERRPLGHRGHGHQAMGTPMTVPMTKATAIHW